MKLQLRGTYTPQVTSIVLPYLALTGVLLTLVDINWWLVAVCMLVFGIIGNGVAGHRLIAHRQFKPAIWVRRILYLLCTLAAFAPVWYWRAQHWHHHKYADHDIDVHSPHTRSFWDSFFGWALMQKYVRLVLKTERASLKESLDDPDLKFYVENNYRVIWAFVLLALIVSPTFVLAYLVYYWFEVLRLGTITSLAHMNIPFSYRNFETEDKSKNNLLLGYLTFGFGWHNNHHAKPMMLDTQIHWWEFDLEAKIAKLINLIPGRRA